MQKKRIVAVVVLGAVGVLGAVRVSSQYSRGQNGQVVIAADDGRPNPHNVVRYPYDLQSNFIGMPLPPGMEAYGRLRGDRMQEFVKAIVDIALKDRDEGNLLWGRTAGTKNDVLAEDYVMSKFKEFGLQDVHKQSFNLAPQWFPTSWGLTATANGQTQTFKTARASGVALPAGGVDLEPVWVGWGTESDFAGRDVKGKMAVIMAMPTPGVHSNSADWLGASKRAADKGAAAVLINIAIPGNVQVQVSPSPRSAEGLTTFTMGTDDTRALRAMMEKGPVKVRAQYTFEMRPNLTDQSVWGTLPGTTDEDIIVAAHHDAVFTGTQDNASALAVMLEMAEYYSKIPKEQRRRTLKFVTTAGHHPGSAGTQWMHDNRDTFLAKTALYLNLEHVAEPQWDYSLPVNGWPTLRLTDNINAHRWWVYGSERLAGIVLNNFKMFGVTIWDTMETNASGDMGHVERDIPSMQIIDSGMFYHTDFPEIAPKVGMEAVARAFTKTIDDVNKVDRKDLLEVPGTMTSSATGGK